MKRILLLSLLFTCLFAFKGFSQTTVSGKVTSSEDGSAIPGVNVILKGTTNGTTTDTDGNYRLSVPSEGGVLVFSFIGLISQEVTIGSRTTIDVVMDSDVKQLSEVVVTAQGIQRKKEALGFAVSSVGKEEIENKTEGDLARVLRSKASGVQITQQSGLSGSGTNIIIRGYTSINGDNQPLFIVDGVPFNGGTNTLQLNGTGDNDNFVNGNNTTSRFLDLDPNNIADVSILKGLAASTLYGSQGRNGVILITTKNGAAGVSNKKMEITVTQSGFANQIASLPDYQDSFGNGFDQVFGWFFSNWGPSFEPDGVAGFLQDATVDENGNLPHPYSQFSNPALRAVFPEFQEGQPLHDYAYQPYDNVKSFFRTGQVYTTSVNVRGKSNDGLTTYNVNYGYLTDEGFTPGNELDRQTFGVGGSTKLINNFTINATMNLTRTEFVSPPIAASFGNGAFGTGSSIFGHVFFTPRSIDLANLPFENPVDRSSVYYRNGNDIQNPNWTARNAFTSQLTNRVFGTFGVKYDITDDLNITYRLGYDIANEQNANGQNRGGVEGDVTGNYTTFSREFLIWDNYATLNGLYEIFPKGRLSFNVGATSRRIDENIQGVASTNQLVFGTFRHFNFSAQSGIQRSREQNIVGVLGQAELDYDGLLFVTVAARNDWVSNFAEGNRSLFYPSISSSLILSEVLPGIVDNTPLDLVKIRAGFGTSAGFADGFPTASNLAVDGRDFIDQGGNIVSSNTTGAQLGNTDLQPERQEEFEIGLELRAFNGRLTADVSGYFRTTTDLITPRPLDPSTGFTSTFVNIGEVQNRGAEVDLGYQFINSGPIKWRAKANFTLARSKVTDIGDDATEIAIAGFAGGLGNYAVEGRPLGVMLGTRIQRSPDDEFVVNSIGRYVEEQGLFEIGNPIPDYTLNVSNTVSWKGLNLNFIWNYVQGGDFYSATVSTLLGRGLTTDTEDRLNPFVLPGVIDNGDGTFRENDLQINNSSFYFSNVLFGPEELQVYDATTIRLQEISLSYTIPKSLIEKTPFGSITVTGSGFNVWFKALNVPDGTNFDPNVVGTGVGNGQGFDFLNGPSSRRFGGTVKFTF